MLRRTFYISKHPLGPINNLQYGVCCLLDGLTCLLTLGFISSSFCLWQTRSAAKRHIDRLIANRNNKA